MDDYKYIDIRFNSHSGCFYDKDILLDWIDTKLGKCTQWTFGEEVGAKTGLIHFHLRVKYLRSEDLGKTTIGQQFTTWYKAQFPKGVPLKKGQNHRFIRNITQFDPSEKHFFAYCLKEQKTLNQKNSFGFSDNEILELHTIGKTLFENKIKYNNIKKLKEESNNNMWTKLCQYLDTALDPNTEGYAHLFDVYDDDDNPIPPTITFGGFNKYWHALGALVVQFYVEHEDCQVPFNLDNKMIRYSLKKKYISTAVAFSRITKIK